MLEVCGHALSPFVAVVLESIFLYYSILQLSNYPSPFSVFRIGKNDVKIVSKLEIYRIAKYAQKINLILHRI